MSGTTDDDGLGQFPKTCSFCQCDSEKMYICPKCSLPYCSLRCYKCPKHAKCSEKFYEEQITQYMGVNRDPPLKPDESLKTATSFEDYMKRKKEEDELKSEDDKNPQIEVDEDEEVLFDSDEEPEYLSKVTEKSVADYEKLDTEDLNFKLTQMGVGSLVDDDDQMERLYGLLNDEEKKAFTRLAEAMHYDEVGISKSCFVRKQKPKR